MAALCMDDNQRPKVIFSYTDGQAVDEGVLVDIRRGPLNRVSRALFDAFTKPMGDPRPIQPVTDVTRLMGVIDTMLKCADNGHEIAVSSAFIFPYFFSRLVPRMVIRSVSSTRTR